MPDYLITRFQPAEGAGSDYPATRAELDIPSMVSGGGSVRSAADGTTALDDWYSDLTRRAKKALEDDAKYVAVEIGEIVGIEIHERTPTMRLKETYPGA